MVTRILIFDSDENRSQEWKSSLEAKHHWVISHSDPIEAKERIQSQHFHLCLWPIDSHDQASELLELKRLRPQMAVVATSQSSDSGLIVDCMRYGASHFWNRDEGNLAHMVQSVLDRIQPEGQEETLEDSFCQMVGRHPRIREVFDLIQQVKNSESNVLITGESGTGKELVAQAIHLTSQRKNRPWVAVNCGAIPGNLLESELFGHTKGAFTGATQNRVGRFKMAGNGTLFLDEIGDLSFDLQAKILRAIQNRTFEPVGSMQSQKLDARIIVATNKDLEQEVSEGRFREDLFYRLNVIPVYMPPLRSRKTDIPLLVHNFVKKFAEANNKKIAGISEEAMHILVGYNWPGNVRELENLMERVVVLKRNSDIIEPKDFPVGYFRNVKLDRFVANVALPDDGLDFNEAVNDFENELILQALRRTGGNKNKAATLLKLNRTTLVEKLKRKNLQVAS